MTVTDHHEAREGLNLDDTKDTKTLNRGEGGQGRHPLGAFVCFVMWYQAFVRFVVVRS